MIPHQNLLMEKPLLVLLKEQNVPTLEHTRPQALKLSSF